MYLVTINQQGFLPNSEPLETNNLNDAINAVKSIKQDWIDSGANWNKWENLSKLRAAHFKIGLPITVGLLLHHGETFGNVVSITKVQDDE